MNKKSVHFPLLAAVGLVSCLLAIIGLHRLDIDTDVVRSLPAEERVIADALEIFANHPIHDQVAVDITVDRDDPDLLVECGALLEERMRASGFFSQVGTRDIGSLLPELAQETVRNLPRLFTSDELEAHVAPRLESTAIQARFAEMVRNLGSMEGIGQAAFLSIDPLGLKDLVMARMAQLAPTTKARIYKGNILSADGRHLLVTARPASAGTDTALARDISRLLDAASRELSDTYGHQAKVRVTPVGAYRAALDNEELIRHDVRFALLLSTAGIALLLLAAFPRPLIGLLSLVPALAGTSAALFVYSLFHSSISIMVLGFGGALISITVDHGIAYLLFLDRSQETTTGRFAARELRAVGSLTALFTTIGALIVLSCSDFPVFTELGQFTALGFLFTCLFVHMVFPLIFPSMPPAAPRPLPLHALVRLLGRIGKPGAWAAFFLAIGLSFFARPQFHISLADMSSVSEKTLAADKAFTSVWGDFGAKVYLMHRAGSMEEAQRQDDRLLAKLEEDIRAGRIEKVFVPSMLFPGPERSERNLAAWKAFWTPERRDLLGRELRDQGDRSGFIADAFTPFLALLDSDLPPVAAGVPARYLQLMGISENSASGELVQFLSITPGGNYDAPGFMDRYGEDGRIFDAGHFSERLGAILFSTFSTMFLLIVVTVIVLLFVLHANWQLPLITLLPPFFAFVCTLGTLNLIGHPLDIPALMLSIIIFGMGIDYAIYMVCGYQRYGDARHPSSVLVGSTVLMAGASTLIGFGVLSFAEHSLLRSVGITSLFGIAYSLIGTFFLLPPLLQRYFTSEESGGIENLTLARRVGRRYRRLEAYPRMFARFKLRLDPMFRELPRMLAARKKREMILDVGCGHGVPACWCLEYEPEARIAAIDPDPERVRVAARAVGKRGTVNLGAAPALPVVARPADVILMLDMLHYLDDRTLRTMLEASFQALAPGGIVVTRFVILPPGRRSWGWRLEDFRVKLAGMRPRYRSSDGVATMMVEAGLEVVRNEVSAANEELVWLVARAEGRNGE